MTRKITAIILVCLSALLFCGCITKLFEGSETSEKLPDYYDSSEIVGALFYIRTGEGEYAIEELPAERLKELVAALASMQLKYHALHSDYHWGGRFGIELAYEDGNFMTFDGTKAELRSVSMKESSSSEYKLRSSFLEVTDCEFWEVMQGFFTSIDTETVWSW